MNEQRLDLRFPIKLVFIFLWTCFFFGNVCLAWGPQGHHQIQEAALRLLLATRHPLSPCFDFNKDSLVQLSSLPDDNWIKKGKENPNLHFFKVDAFVSPEGLRIEENAIMRLPIDEYRTIAALYGALLQKNSAYVAEIDTELNEVSLSEMKPTSKPLTRTLASTPEKKTAADFGTAPWRVLELFDLGVQELRQTKIDTAFFYLATLGHYVEDLSLPLNTTLNANGGHYPTEATGVYKAFATDLTSKHTSIENILHFAKQTLPTRTVEGLTRSRILPELFKLVQEGYPDVKKLLDLYAVSSSEAFETQSQPIAEQRMGSGAAVLAKIWALAYEQAGRPELLKCPKINLKSLIGKYPKPDFLP